MTYPPIGEYGAIGDCRCLGLISREGSLDWLCLPRFDSPAVFGALLDADKGGRFRVRPTAVTAISRRYLDNTNVLETVFTTDGGEVRLTDFMPVRSRAQYRESLCPERQVLRIAECLSGEAVLEIHYQPRPTFGGHPVHLTTLGKLGYRCQDREHLLNLQSSLPLRLETKDGLCHGRTVIKKGEAHYFCLSYSEGNVAVIPPLQREYFEQQLASTVGWWRQWSARCTYDGPYLKEVMRSLLALKLLSYAPSGAVIAAPTASLPEIIGGSRNWDYRYCWLRDAAMSIRAFLSSGYTAEAESFLSWMLHSTKLSRPGLRPLYTIYGETHIRERHLDFMNGYRSSRPVRVGNAASKQLQLGVYGEVIQGALAIAQTKKSFDRDTRNMLRNIGDIVCSSWRNPDRGIWEIRLDSRHNTHSKVMCWVALDRLIELHRSGHLRVPLERFSAERDALRESIENNAFNESMGSYTSYFGSREVDISLLMLPIYGYIEAGDRRMRGTYEHIARSLGKNGLFYRFPLGYDGIREGEGTFTMAVFLAAAVLAERGDLAAAGGVFDRALRCGNDLGLFAEETDPEDDSLLGNFPQAYTHVGLINAAIVMAGKLKSRDGLQQN